MSLDLSSLRKALAALRRALVRCEAAPADEELRDACIPRFEFTFELAWKMIKRRLELDLPSRDEVDALSWRGLMRRATEAGLVDNPTPWFEWRDCRNLTSHTYDAAKAAQVRAALPGFAQAAAELLVRLERRSADDAGPQ